MEEPMRAIIYDIEILRAIPDRDGKQIQGIEYCEGWKDHANMGISCIGVWDYVEERARVFGMESLDAFLDLCDDRDLLIGFNNIPFDNAVINATRNATVMDEGKSYDLLREIWRAAGLPIEFDFKTHGGVGLDAMCERNFGTKKTGTGAHAPVLWQQGNYCQVIDYCLNDIRLTKQMMDQVLAKGPLINSKTGLPMMLRQPFSPAPL